MGYVFIPVYLPTEVDAFCPNRESHFPQTVWPYWNLYLISDIE